MMTPLCSKWMRVMVAASMVIVTGCIVLGTALAQEYVDGEVTSVEHYRCYSPATFYSANSPTHFEFGESGFFFPANPFVLHTYLGGVDYWAEMRPQGSTIDATGRKEWKQASITVECFVARRRGLFGVISTPYMVIRREGGYLVNVGGSASGIDNPTDDTYVVWLDGVRFVCSGASTDDGTRIERCEAT